MSIDLTRRRSRRAVLAAAFGSVGALVARSVIAPEPTQAADGGNIVIGQPNTGSTPTGLSGAVDTIRGVLEVSTTQGAAVVATTSSTISGAPLIGTGPIGGVQGTSSGASGAGVRGMGPQGVVGSGNTGIAGYANPLIPGTPPPSGVYGAGSGTGVFGTGSPGVHGESTTGTGVDAKSGSGAAVKAISASGTGAIAQTNTGKIASSAFVGSGAPPTPEPVTAVVPAAMYGEANGADGTGVWGFSTNATGTGVYGEGSTGVWGFGGWGVFGASDATGTGVYGFSGASVPAAPIHTGVFGYTDTGVGVQAQAGTLATGRALNVVGRSVFSRSGRATVAAAKSYVDVDLSTKGGLGGTPLCFATPMTQRSGVFVNCVRANYPSTGRMRIYLNKVASTTAVTYVAWVVLS
jgi:hypothetical protein